MFQELFRVGSFAVSPFGVMLVVAFLAAFFQLSSNFRRLGIGGPDEASSIVVAGGLGGIVGAKIYYAILNGDPKLLLERYGLVWYGGFLLATPLVLWMARRHRLPLWPTLDAATPALALGYGLGRIGCFLVGDDYGRPTNLPWGVAFENGLPPTTAWHLRREFGVALPDDMPGATLLEVHPTQLYETAIALAVWWIAMRWLRSGRPAGSTALLVFALLAAERFGIEFLRVKDDRFLGPFTLAQAISVAVLATVAIVAWRRRRMAPAAGA